MNIAQLKTNERVIQALEEFNLKFEDISIFKRKANQWETLQAGTKSEVTLYIEDDRVGIMKAV